MPRIARFLNTRHCTCCFSRTTRSGFCKFGTGAMKVKAIPIPFSVSSIVRRLPPEAFFRHHQHSNMQHRLGHFERLVCLHSRAVTTKTERRGRESLTAARAATSSKRPASGATGLSLAASALSLYLTLALSSCCFKIIVERRPRRGSADGCRGRKEEGKRGQGRGRSPERAKGVRREGRREGGREGVFRARMYIV